MRAFLASAMLLMICVACLADDRATVAVSANINEAIMPVARGQKYSQPLDSFLTERGIGGVTGGGTTLGPSGEPGWVDVGFDLRDPEINVPVVARRLRELGAPSGSYLRYSAGGKEYKLPVAD